MDSYVFSYMARLSKHLSTQRTRERSRTRVCALVVTQLPQRAKLLLTRVTVKRLLTAMNTLVCYQVGGVTVRLSTDVTMIRTVTCQQQRLTALTDSVMV